MRVRIAGATRTGRAIDLRDCDVDCDSGLGVTTVAAAVRGESDGTAADEGTLAVECPEPGPVHDRVGAVRPGMVLSLRPALAAAARSRGRTAPQADDLAAVRERLDALDVPDVDRRAARRRVADASDSEAELRERVASLRGEVRALRETDAADDAVGEAERELADATRRLSAVETDRIAAEQALDRARERTADHREVRRERLRLQDRAANLRRAAREWLADAIRDDFEAARSSVPADLGESAATDSDEAIPASLAVARVADMSAPVVVSGGANPFEDAAEAAAWLGGPVMIV